MRRGILVIGILIFAGALIATWTVAYRAGESDGRSAVGAARQAFATRIAGAPASNTGATGSSPAGGGNRGGPGSNATPASGQSSAPSGTARGGGTAAAGSAVTTAGAGGRGAAALAGLVGRVTKVDGQTLTLQQTDNTTVMVTTTSDTMVRKLVAGALTDLKVGDAVIVDGTRTGDTVAAKAITQSVAPGGGGSGGGASGTPGGRGPGGGAAGGNPASSAGIFGSIKSIDGANVMVQSADGTMLTVKTDGATVVRMQQPGTLADIKAGDFLTVFGEKTGDTAYLARTITNQGAASG